MTWSLRLSFLGSVSADSLLIDAAFLAVWIFLVTVRVRLSRMRAGVEAGAMQNEAERTRSTIVVRGC